MKFKELTIVSVATVVCTAVSASGAMAQNFKKFGSEAGWEVNVNEGMGPGCLIMQTTADGTQVQMGIDNTRGANSQTGYLALYTRADENIAADELFSAEFDVDGQKFAGAAVGQQTKGFQGAFAPVNNPSFVYDLAKRNILTIRPAGSEPITISLAGTDAAFKMLRECQDAQ